jgi:hypothetical protein
MSELKRRMTRRALWKITFIGVTAILSGCDERRVTSKRPTIEVKENTSKGQFPGCEETHCAPAEGQAGSECSAASRNSTRQTYR